MRRIATKATVKAALKLPGSRAAILFALMAVSFAVLASRAL